MSRNSVIDIAKYVAALLVIGIHTRPLSNLSTEADFWLVEVLCRLAVPFFAVCTGYYLFSPSFDKQQNHLFRRTWFKIVSMYFGWSIFYLLIHLFQWYDSNTLCLGYFLGWLKASIVNCSYFHLWYFVALIYGMLWYWLVCRFIKPKYWPILILALWSLEVLAYGYRSFFPQFQSYYALWATLSSVAVSFTRMLPLLLLGSWIAYAKPRISFTWLKTATLICFIGLCIEVSFLREHGAEHFSYVVFTLPLTYFLFLSLLKVGENIHFKSRIFAKISMVVYCIHPAIIFILNYLSEQLYAYYVFLSATIISTIFGFAYVFLKQHLVNSHLCVHK